MNEKQSFAAYAFMISGVCFVLFPLIRPFFDESSIAGAVQFASARWVIAHAMGMAGFILLALGLQGAFLRLRTAGAGRLSYLALILGWIGCGLTLPFFGAEAFSLQVIGRAAAEQDSLPVLALVNLVRFGPGLLSIGTGLILVALSTILLAVAAGRSRALPLWAAILLAAGFVVYIPQLQGAPVFQPIRIVVALVIAAGCSGLAARLLRASD
jgi:hypothetical protein